jgi:acetaldehyde dehydrogenase (acetylating)
LGSSRVAVQLATSQEGFNFMKLVSYDHYQTLKDDLEILFNSTYVKIHRDQNRMLEHLLHSRNVIDTRTAITKTFIPPVNLRFLHCLLTTLFLKHS